MDVMQVPRPGIKFETLEKLEGRFDKKWYELGAQFASDYGNRSIMSTSIHPSHANPNPIDLRWSFLI